MSENEEQTPAESPAPRKPHSARYYKKLLLAGSGPEWRQLMVDIKQNYHIAYRVAEAVAQLKPQHRTIQTLWKSAVEIAQPGIHIRIGKGVDEDDKVRNLKRTKYSE